jgi:ATP-dependent exoDNAse (exonuclease V) beta subunit
MTPYEIKKAWRENGAEQARLGTRLHSDIECFMNNDIRDDDIQIDYTHQDLLSIYEFESENTRDEKHGAGFSKVDFEEAGRSAVEWSYFLNFVRDHAEYKPYRTEMKIYSEQLKIAGSIDMLYKNSDGSFSIFDWKRSKEIQKYNMYKKFSKTESVKHLPDLNFVHYSLQLNLYKYILETNYNFKIKDLILVQLHPNFKNYKLYECLDLTSELDLLIKERKNMLLTTS